MFESSRLQKLAGLKEQIAPISYTGLVLTSEEHRELITILADKIPDGWELIAHHVTVNMGSYKGDRQNLGRSFQIKVKSFAKDDKVCAVGVEVNGLEVKANPHITIAVDRANGGKPAMSNKLDWNNAEQMAEVNLTGTLFEVRQGDERFAEQLMLDMEKEQE